MDIISPMEKNPNQKNSAFSSNQSIEKLVLQPLNFLQNPNNINLPEIHNGIQSNIIRIKRPRTEDTLDAFLLSTAPLSWKKTKDSLQFEPLSDSFPSPNIFHSHHSTQKPHSTDSKNHSIPKTWNSSRIYRRLFTLEKDQSDRATIISKNRNDYISSLIDSEQDSLFSNNFDNLPTFLISRNQHQPNIESELDSDENYVFDYFIDPKADNLSDLISRITKAYNVSPLFQTYSTDDIGKEQLKNLYFDSFSPSGIPNGTILPDPSDSEDSDDPRSDYSSEDEDHPSRYYGPGQGGSPYSLNPQTQADDGSHQLHQPHGEMILDLDPSSDSAEMTEIRESLGLVDEIDFDNNEDLDYDEDAMEYDYSKQYLFSLIHSGQMKPSETQSLFTHLQHYESESER